MVRRGLFLAGLRRFETSAGTPPHRVAQTLWYPMRVAGRPSLVVDTSAHAARKAAAVACFGSQLTRSADAAPTLLNGPLSVASIDARDRYWGSHLGVSHGEPFMTDAVVGVADPVAFGRANPYAGAALLFPEGP